MPPQQNEKNFTITVKDSEQNSETETEELPLLSVTQQESNAFEDSQPESVP